MLEKATLALSMKETAGFVWMKYEMEIEDAGASEAGAVEGVEVDLTIPAEVEAEAEAAMEAGEAEVAAQVVAA